MLRAFYNNRFVQKIYMRRTELEKVLIISALFSTAMMTARIIVTGEWRFLFLVWNLFLAFVPYYISKKLLNTPGWIKARWKLLLVSLAWLLFIPNSFYILTDLFHVRVSEHLPRWFDLTLIFSFAWNGLMLGILSVDQMERIFIRVFHARFQLLFLYAVMGLIALGVYIGRYMRFNSWDIITDPFQLLSEISEMIIHPFQNLYAWAMIISFSVLMTIIYICIKRLSKSIP